MFREIPEYSRFSRFVATLSRLGQFANGEPMRNAAAGFFYKDSIKALKENRRTDNLVGIRLCKEWFVSL